ncbi:hypothetical protein Q604_UNBC15812G0001, partial [human gut metagenome]
MVILLVNSFGRFKCCYKFCFKNLCESEMNSFKAGEIHLS